MLGARKKIYILGANNKQRDHVALLVTLFPVRKWTRDQISQPFFQYFHCFYEIKRSKIFFLLVDQYFSGPTLIFTSYFLTKETSPAHLQYYHNYSFQTDHDFPFSSSVRILKNLSISSCLH